MRTPAGSISEDSTVHRPRGASGAEHGGQLRVQKDAQQTRFGIPTMTCSRGWQSAPRYSSTVVASPPDRLTLSGKGERSAGP